MNLTSPSRLAAALLLGLAAAGAAAQSSCDSDGQRRPAGLLERFISADCESCWADGAAPRPRPGDVALDWIVPGRKGDDAPLSAAATGDALARLQALRREPPQAADSARHAGPARPAQRLRVAHGLVFNGYVGASIELKPGSGGPWHAWLLLVETIPAGADGTPVERNLVRNALQVAWDQRQPLSKAQQRRLFESRPLSVAEGARAPRLRVVGWVEDARGRITAIAQSRCASAPGKG